MSWFAASSLPHVLSYVIITNTPDGGGCDDWPSVLAQVTQIDLEKVYSHGHTIRAQCPSSQLVVAPEPRGGLHMD